MKIVSASAPGKCILLGGLPLIYGVPAITMAISQYTTCTIEEINENKIQINLSYHDEPLDFSDYNDLISNIPKKFKQIAQCFKIFKEKYYVKLENLRITLASNLYPSSGLGSSASTAVSLVSALSEFCNVNLEKTLISSFAWNAFHGRHGTPTGIDNIICTFGKMISFQKGNFQFIPFSNDLKFLISHTNIVHDTKKAIQRVNALKKAKPDECNRIFEKISTIVKSAEIELKNGDLIALGNLMNSNQALLAKLGVSNGSISDIVNISHDNGALGSIQTGVGVGKCVITLGKENMLKNIALILKEKEYNSFLTNIDSKGVKIERK